jgi:hypothetical protein
MKHENGNVYKDTKIYSRMALKGIATTKSPEGA